jgi:hypothetical protein
MPKTCFSKNIKKLDVHIVITFLQNAESTIRHMIVLIVFGRNETLWAENNRDAWCIEIKL